MAEVVWLREVQADVERLFLFLRKKNSKAANKILLLFRKGSEQLACSPELGISMDDETGRRELFLPFGAGAYILRYQLDVDKVGIIRVWHSRENRD
ncbi:MAG: type II toxin-antitoxin system RelE/ParE family toxin [Methylococcaceae bacterium]|nr:type II toxin-antitoxin system RelE/ParE family toxin [Methylococcaceae bacterium]